MLIDYFKKSIVESLKPDERVKRKNDLCNPSSPPPPRSRVAIDHEDAKKKDAFNDIITRALV